MPKVTAQQGADKYRSGVQGGSQRYINGVNSVTTAPSQQAIAQQNKMVTNWLDSVNSGKWAQNLGNVTLQAWQQAAVNKGAQNYSASADAASTKYAQWAQNAYTVIQQIQDEIEAMPSTNMQDNINRMIHNVTRMSELLG